MNFMGSYYFDADQPTVWGLLMDSQTIASALPGVDQLIPIEGETDAWTANAKISAAIISGTFTGTIRMTERNPIDSFRLTLNGEGQGSVISGTALISLTYNSGLEQTIIQWDANADLSGSLARIGQSAMKVAANIMTKQFFRNLAKQQPSHNRKEEIGDHRSLDSENE